MDSLQVAGLSGRPLTATAIGTSPFGEKNQLCEDPGGAPSLGEQEQPEGQLVN